MAARRRGQRASAAATLYSNDTSQNINRGGMFLATPPPLMKTRPTAPTTPGSGGAAPSFHKARVLKQPPDTSVCGSQSNQWSDVSSMDSYVQEKLAFDELLRVQRSRAEDISQLIIALGASLSAEYDAQSEQCAREREKSRRAARFREEWRVGREDQVLERLREEDARERVTLSEDDVKMKMDVVRGHIRRSIHLFLTVERSIPPGQPLDLQSTTSTAPSKTKLSSDLFYAQQMDRLLRELDQNHPFTVVQHAIQDARAKFQRLLQGSSECDAQPPPTARAPLEQNLTQSGTRRSDDDQEENNGSSNTTTANDDVLHLYENVVDARAIAQSTQHTKTKVKTHATGSVLVPSAAFLENLGKQRDSADRQVAEALAQTHWRRVCARRIQNKYRQYQQRRRWSERAAALGRRVEQRAATVVQTVFLDRIRTFRALEDAKSATMRMHQARRIALCVFWKWIYKRRCGFGGFQFALQETTVDVLVGIIRIQSAWRRWKATQHVALRRAFRSIRRKRAKQRQWLQWRQRSQATAPLSHRLAEWHCHVAMEKRRVARELRREHVRFATEWTKYESRLEKDVMKSRLPSDWIPQLDPVSGESFYLNVQTTKTTREHPNLLLFRQLLKKQKLRAEQLYDERLQRLEQYLERLDADSDAMSTKLFEKIHAALRAASR